MVIENINSKHNPEGMTLSSDIYGEYYEQNRLM
jgi:hypothetical protein